MCWGAAGVISSWGVVQGSRYRPVKRGWVLSAFLFNLFEDGLENFAVGNCVGIIEVVVYSSLLMNIKTLNGIAVDVFSLKL